MVYVETTQQSITFDKIDILTWAKTFAAKQMGIDMSNITNDDIKFNGDDNISITVTHTKQSSNIKE